MTIEQALSKFGFICEEIKGTSMNPLFKAGRDKVYIEKYNGGAKVGDILLYKRQSGELVLHRLVKILPSSYVLCGDNHLILEYGVTDSDVLGICTGYYKNGKYKNLKTLSYKLYLAFWGRNRFLRRIFLKIKSLFK